MAAWATARGACPFNFLEDTHTGLERRLAERRVRVPYSHSPAPQTAVRRRCALRPQSAATARPDPNPPPRHPDASPARPPSARPARQRPSPQPRPPSAEPAPPSPPRAPGDWAPLRVSVAPARRPGASPSRPSPVRQSLQPARSASLVRFLGFRVQTLQSADYCRYVAPRRRCSCLVLVLV
jgi:hypothetical protein